MSIGFSKMIADDVKVAVGHFLELVINGRGSEEENIRALETALDMIAWLQNLVEITGPGSDADAPQHEFDKMRALIAEQFPAFGVYAVPTAHANANGLADSRQADAVDDLAEIACRLYEIAWRFQNTSDDDALRVFATGYRHDWRSHLRALQWYLETRRENPK